MKAAVIGSGNIGTDLLIKIIRGSGNVTAAAMIGIDPESEGLARARRLSVPTSADGVAGLLALDGFDEIDVIFDATSAAAHHRNAAALAPYGKTIVDLTPAAIGPYVVPSVNLDEHLDAPNVNMVTCGGQATVPIVAAVSAVAPVHYAEIVASISSRSAARAPAPTSTSSPRPPPAPSKRWAARPVARRSSCSTPPNHRC